jgi:hypothetical protein
MKKLGWFDRMLIKIAVAKAAARGHCDSGAILCAESLARAFDTLNAINTHRSGAVIEQEIRAAEVSSAQISQQERHIEPQ